MHPWQSAHLCWSKVGYEKCCNPPKEQVTSIESSSDSRGFHGFLSSQIKIHITQLPLSSLVVVFGCFLFCLFVLILLGCFCWFGFVFWVCFFFGWLVCFFQCFSGAVSAVGTPGGSFEDRRLS